MCLRLCWTAAAAATVLTGAAFADVTVSQSNDPTASIEGEFASLFGAEHKTVAALPAPKLNALAAGPEKTVAPVAEKPVAEKPVATKKDTAAPVAGTEVAAAQKAGEKAVAPVAARPAATPAAEKRAAKGFGFLRKPVVPEAPALIRYDEAWLASQPAATGDAQWQCLRTAIYFEARGESIRGQFAVAEVVLNRVDSARYPSSICGVVQQTCQFSFTCDGISETMHDRASAERAGRIARVMMDGAPRGLTMGATYFHTRAVRPSWAGRFDRTAAIGAHLFYRQP